MGRPPADRRSPLGARLKAARLAVGYDTAREAAQACGMDAQQYCDVEGGTDAKYATLERIILGLGIDPRDLFPGWMGPQTPPPGRLSRGAGR